ncbi:RND family efflux transporter, MFP subunit [Thiohalospira halophila DSM 15071]|uniref:RND family efflux transporter, MFP subunit n=1 Tax=Thiohalospira halophila DSM 15071 TaxID=1123397 RepID=A0A1I1NVV8_9GAMM|nr:efflux RND transporter periplasmic adaptor subunit [Thiohalospira halophila]SFD01472.1 RND family efflux transporter, MFP subunit [Thiohalospira halophila DSM 15071]
MRRCPPSPCARPVIPGLALSLLLALSGCGGESGEEGREAMASDRAMLVQADKAREQAVDITEHTIGRIRARTAPTLRAEVAGRVVGLEVDAGEPVRQGELLATLDAEPFRLARDAARSEVDRLRAQQRNQQRQVERLRAQAEEQYVSESELDAATTALDEIRARLAGAEARLEQAQRDLRLTRIRAPVEGRVVERHISPGDYPGVGEPLFELVAPEGLRAELPLPETAAARVEPGMGVRLWLPSAPEEVVEARVTALRERVGDASRAFDALVDFDNPGNWRDGAGVVGNIVRDHLPSAVVVDETSVVQRPAGEVVYALEDGQAVEKVVETGFRFDGQVVIREGLAAGTTIARDGADYLSDGAAVRLRGGDDG